jgi:hypothetical protein
VDAIKPVPVQPAQTQATPAQHYRLCPHCCRAVTASSGERYCINDGAPMLSGCPACGAPIVSPYTRYCGSCGAEMTVPVQS